MPQKTDDNAPGNSAAPSSAVRGAAGKLNVVVSMADAARDLARQKRRRDDPPPAEPRGADKVPPGKWTPNNLGLPSEEPCPVIPLGIEGSTYHLIDASGQFLSLASGDFSHAGIQSLFAATPNYPQWAWPRWGRAPKVEADEKPKPPPIKSFEDDAVRQALFLACTRKGLFSPTDKLRGRGMWALRGGGLAYHAGEEIWTWAAGKDRPAAQDTGLVESHLYPRMPSLPAPWTEPIAPADNPAGAVIETLRKWNWTRPAVDPVLMLGWIGVAFLGGALDWRSAVLLIGDKGTGKSTLQDAMKDLFGDALFHSSDTTAAGIYQKMAHDTRPIALDELEPDADSRKVNAVVQLMRDASSGAMGRRGGADGSPSEFQMRSAFLFSAINNPITSSQDLSRIAILRLAPLERSQTQAPAIDADTCGRKLLAVLMREWPRFEATRALYMRALGDGGHDPRGQKTYGTLLAAADCLFGAVLGEEHDVPLAYDVEGRENERALAWWAEHLSAEALPEVEDAMPNWRACIYHLLTAQVEPWRNGARATVGKCLADLDERRVALADEHGGVVYTFDQARRDLELTGLGLIAPGALSGVPADAGYVLAIPNKSQLVQKLYRDTPWANGSWKDALRSCPHEGVMLTDKSVNRVMINGERARCTLVVMSHYRDAPER